MNLLKKDLQVIEDGIQEYMTGWQKLEIYR